MIGEILIGILNNDANYSEAIGTNSGDNVNLYPDVAPQGQLKAFAVYTLISNVPLYDKDQRGFQLPIVQIDHYATTLTQANSLQSLIITALDRYKGTVAGYNVNDVRIMNEGTAYKHALLGYKIDIEFKFRINT